MEGRTSWEPFRDFVTLREAMNNLFNQSVIEPAAGTAARERVRRLPVDAYSTEDAVYVEASLPGVRPEDVEISVDGDTLTIRGTIPEPAWEGRNYTIHERFHGPVERTLALNVPVDAANADATFENGMLTLRIPKSEAAKPRKITVKGA
jgi:HSP20 family protein